MSLTLGLGLVAGRAASVPLTPPVLVSISPDLGDIFAGAPITLTGTNMSVVTGVTFGGTAATSVVAVNSTTVTCAAPAKTAAGGPYDVICANAAGNSNTLAAAYEAWSPLTDYAAARVYQADREVTSASSATRNRFGAGATDIMVGATYGAYRPGPDPDPGGIITDGGDPACDGQGFCELASGRLLLAGGAPGGHAADVVNTIWYSDDRAKTWAVLLTDAAGSSTRPAPAHTFGFFTMTVSGTEYVYWIGGDPFTPTGDVFRSADGGATWARISQTAPTSGVVLGMFGVLAGVIYLIGGQTEAGDANVANKVTYKSDDYGVTWSALAAGSNAPATVWGTQLGTLPVKDGCLWVCGSGRVDTVENDFSNAVHKFDGTTWTTVLAEDYVTPQFLPRRYHAVAVYGTRLWILNGTTWDGVTLTADTIGAYYSDDGVTWTNASSLVPTGWTSTHAGAVCATSAGLYMTFGLSAATCFIIRQHTGALASAWGDQGSANLDLAQATAGKKPILDTAAFALQAGLVFTRGQLLELAAPDRDLVNGHYEAYFVGRTLNFDASQDSGANPPATVIGAVNGSAWNAFGFNADALSYVEYSGGYNLVQRGSLLNDDEVRLLGITHETALIKWWKGTVQQGATVITSTFDTSWTGWDNIGAGYTEADAAEIVLGAVVVLTEAAASDATFRTKLNKWAKKWGSVST